MRIGLTYMRSNVLSVCKKIRSDNSMAFPEIIYLNLGILNPEL
jgi:hypothetical protein